VSQALLNGQAQAETTGDSWQTPDDLFRAYDWEFGFTLDAAARSHNTKLPNFPPDGLVASWGGERVWCNPPYSDIRPWMEKASRREADVAALLVPVRTGTDWWRLYVQDPEGRLLCDAIRYFRKRVRFIGAPGSPSWETALVIFRRRPQGDLDEEAV
jgi:phage N-6-adenine-methyltransferase